MKSIRSFVKRFFLLFPTIIKRNHNSKVLFYHDLGLNKTDMGTSVELFRSHIEAIKRSGYSIVDSICNREGEVMICFDDGWEGIFDNRKVLEEMNLHPTVFLVTSFIGTNGYLSREEISILRAQGVIFQSHTCSHKELSSLNLQELNDELRSSKEYLEDLLGESVDSICFPRGRFSNQVISSCLHYGYTKLYSSLHGSYYDRVDSNIICRKLVQSYTPKEVEYVLNGDSSFLYHKAVSQQFVQ